MKIVLVADASLFSEQLVLVLRVETRFEVVHLDSNLDATVATVQALRPDVVLLDPSACQGGALQVLERVRRARQAGPRFVVITDLQGPVAKEAFMKMGASASFERATGVDACLHQLRAWLPPLPGGERERMQAVRETGLLDSEPQAMFDNITRLAAELLDVPMVLITLVDHNRQWFLSRQGVALSETSRSSAFCAHSILTPGITVVTDAWNDERFHDNPLVVGEPHIRFYAGATLSQGQGHALGTLCVLDTQPRALSERERRALLTLADCVVAEIEVRRRVLLLEAETERRRAAEQHAVRLATRDELTHLCNRNTFRDRLEQHVRLAARQQKGMAVLFIDLDRFKPINDGFGHHVGDETLVRVASCLTRAVRASDTVARLGGDEFAIILPDMDQALDVAQFSNKLVEQLRTPFTVFGHTLDVGASVGAALFPADGRDAEELIRHADLAMYESKALGGNRVTLFDPSMALRAHSQRVLHHELRTALDDQQLVVHFQPQIGVSDGRLRGVEALVRWNHPVLGLVYPDQFISLAETGGLIRELTRQVLAQSLDQLRAWDRLGLTVPRVAVNASPIDLHNGFAKMVRGALEQRGIATDRLEMEVTESALGGDTPAARDTLQQLRHWGVQVAVDDFGVGYSSLGQLHHLPMDCMKIDRSFIAELESAPSEVAIVRAVVQMAHAIDVRTIAEGVETEAQRTRLESLNCDAAQGYLYSPPLSAHDMTEWLRKHVNSLERPASDKGCEHERDLDCAC